MKQLKHLPNKPTLKEIKDYIKELKKERANFEANVMDLTNPLHQELWKAFNDTIAFLERQARLYEEN